MVRERRCGYLITNKLLVLFRASPRLVLGSFLCCHAALLCRAVGANGPGGPPSTYYLTDQFTLLKPGRQVMPTTLQLAPPPGFSDLPTVLEWDRLARQLTHCAWASTCFFLNGPFLKTSFSNSLMTNWSCQNGFISSNWTSFPIQRPAFKHQQ